MPRKEKRWHGEQTMCDFHAMRFQAAMRTGVRQ